MNINVSHATKSYGAMNAYKNQKVQNIMFIKNALSEFRKNTCILTGV